MRASDVPLLSTHTVSWPIRGQGAGDLAPSAPAPSLLHPTGGRKGGPAARSACCLLSPWQRGHSRGLQESERAGAGAEVWAGSVESQFGLLTVRPEVHPAPLHCLRGGGRGEVRVMDPRDPLEINPFHWCILVPQTSKVRSGTWWTRVTDFDSSCPRHTLPLPSGPLWSSSL